MYVWIHWSTIFLLVVNQWEYGVLGVDLFYLCGWCVSGGCHYVVLSLLERIRDVWYVGYVCDVVGMVFLCDFLCE